MKTSTLVLPLSLVVAGLSSACGSMETTSVAELPTTMVVAQPAIVASSPRSIGALQAIATPRVTTLSEATAVPQVVAVPVLQPQRSDADRLVQVLSGWPEKPRLGALQMAARYGPPQEVTGERIIWHNPGPFKRITVYRAAQPHDFPMPHEDYMEHTISYYVPQNKVGDVVALDGSSTINRTLGELSARSDSEGNNILTLNLANDIVTGRKTVAQARQAFGQIAKQKMTGMHPAYARSLQFQTSRATAFSDQPVIAGAPLRAAELRSDTTVLGAAPAGSDAEVLAILIALGRNEVHAAMEAEGRNLSPAVRDYAHFLHRSHGTHMERTMQLGQQIGVRPVITSEVQQLENKGASGLASMVPLRGLQFEQAFVDAKVKGHIEGMALIDNKLLPNARNRQLREHLVQTRRSMVEHLERARALQASMAG